MTSIVFSRDRALQLHAFLRSYQDHVTPLKSLFVLFAASSTRHEKAYAEVFEKMRWATPVSQVAFRSDVLRLVPRDGLVMFFMDDQLFVRPWNATSAKPDLCLRLGLHLTHCYPYDAAQSVPPHVCAGRHVSWRWGDGEYDWRYPLALEGHVFRAAEIRALIELVDSGSPNTLESALQQFVPQFLDRRATCYTESRVLNVPWNRVQDDCPNRHAHGPDAEEMLVAWEEGHQIDVEPVYGTLNESYHQEFPLVLGAR